MYKIIVDSSADMNPELREKYPVTFVPFRLLVEDKEYIDDKEIDVDDFIDAYTSSKVTPKSACPSPNDFYEKLVGADEYYIVTISSVLSGTHDSAVMAKKLFEREGKPGKVHVIDSLSASAGEVAIVKTIHDLKREGKSFEEVIASVNEFISGMSTLFISESLSNLIKNGRISKWKGLLATTFSIYPIMGSNGKGEIMLIEKVRTLNKAYKRLVDMAVHEIKQRGREFVTISHVGNLDRAIEIAKEIAKPFGIEIFVSKAAGLSSLYADKRGIVVSY